MDRPQQDRAAFLCTEVASNSVKVHWANRPLS